VMACHILHQLRHFRRIVSAVGLWAYVAPPQFCYSSTLLQ
jgi:hypothetical protein